jgi:hypothetical protein
LKKGLDARFNYPPSCDDFEMACRPVPDMHKDTKALPVPKKSREEVQGKLSKIREILARATAQENAGV